MKIEPYEVICEDCGGLGLSARGTEFSYLSESVECPKCLGEGKLDFIENIVGKKEDKSFYPVSVGVNWLDASPSHPPCKEIGNSYINTKDQCQYIYDGNVWVRVEQPIYSAYEDDMPF